MNFAERYGPWAVITGASDGTGAEFARQIAAQGVPSVLIARREKPLNDLVRQIRDESGVECVAASIDLSRPDAIARIVAAVGNREVGLLIANAGTDNAGSKFLDSEVSVWRELVQRNVVTVLECTHHFALPMRERGRGGVLIVNSGVAFGGASYMATYAGTKAFELCFVEGLWAELSPFGVDVLTLILGATDTPSIRALLVKKGKRPMHRLAAAAAVAAAGLRHLRDGPIFEMNRAVDEGSTEPMSGKARRERIAVIDEKAKAIFGG